MAKKEKRDDRSSGELLIEAVRAKDLARLTELIAGGADVNEVPEEESPLGAAAEMGEEAMVATLLKAGADPGVGGLVVPLVQAAARGHDRVVKQLLDAGADANDAEEEGFTALMAAARLGRIDLVERLVDAGADPKQRDNDGRSPLHYGEEHPNVAKFLKPLSRAEDVKSLTPTKGAKPADAALLKAADEGKLEKVVALLAAGADVNATDLQKRTPLHLAAKIGEIAIATKLRDAGASIDAVDQFGETPLLYAVSNEPERRAMMKWLVDNGADFNAKDASGRDLLGIADRYLPPDGLGKKKDQEALLELLRELGVISAVGSNLCNVAGEGNVSEVKKLIADGVDPNAIDEQARTPLWMAVSRRRPEVVAVLLKSKADPNVAVGGDDATDTQWGGVTKPCPKCSKPFTSITKQWVCPACGHTFEAYKVWTGWKSGLLLFAWSNGWTPLGAAARLDDVALAGLLLDDGAKVNRGKNDATPLMMACAFGHIEVARLLINRKAKVNAVCKETGSRVTTKLTAIGIAGEAGNLELMELLWSAGAATEGKDAARLIAAARAGDVKRVKSLLAAGVDLNAPDPFKNDTAINAAASAAWPDVVEVLLKAGAPIAAPKRGFAPLLNACISLNDEMRQGPMSDADVERYVETARRLIAAGASARVAAFGQSPLSLAKDAQCQPMVELLEAALEREKPAAKAAKPKKK